MLRPIYVMLAVGTALTNSASETVLASKELPAYSLQAGKRYRVRGLVRATATNSTNTLRCDVRFGPTTLTGTIVATAAATDVSDNDVVAFDLTFTVRSVNADTGAAVVIVDGDCTAPGAEGTATKRPAFEPVSVTSVAVALKIELTGTWSAASSSNSCQAESFAIDEIA